MNTHIEQLKAWWENAEKGAFSKGDLLIIDNCGGDYSVERATHQSIEDAEDVRILTRAPAPKPAWHDAVAVLASTSIRDRRVFVPVGDGDWLDTNTMREVGPETLTDVVPLIEQKVTKEARDRLWKTIRDLDWDGGVRRSQCKDEIDALLTAALGLDPKENA